MEQLRLQRLATEWAGIQHSAQMRRALQAEVAVRDAFLEVLAREKEVLLAERQDARAIAESAFPDYKRALMYEPLGRGGWVKVGCGMLDRAGAASLLPRAERCSLPFLSRCGVLVQVDSTVVESVLGSTRREYPP